jgi:hypothetical protein
LKDENAYLDAITDSQQLEAEKHEEQQYLPSQSLQAGAEASDDSSQVSVQSS